jgi:hypothetical protein
MAKTLCVSTMSPPISKTKVDGPTDSSIQEEQQHESMVSEVSIDKIDESQCLAQLFPASTQAFSTQMKCV